MMGYTNKYVQYFAALIIVSIFIYAGYTYLTGPSKQGTEFQIRWTLDDRQLVYDLNLPKDLNYTKLWGNYVYFQVRLDINEYSNGTNPEITSLQFHDKQSIRGWIDTFQIPNLLKNMLKAMFDMSREDFNSEDEFGDFSWKPSGGMARGFMMYSFVRTGDPSNNIITITMRDSDTIYVKEKVWDLVIRVPFNGTDYDLTFTRYSKP